jgi:ketosteroid isomerase-like protein
MPSENVAVVEALVAALPADFAAASGSEDVLGAAENALAELAEPDVECVMASPDPAFRQTARGIDGFRESWSDWASAFESFRIEIEDVIDAGDRVVTTARLKGRTKTGGVEMEQRAAAVFTLRSGKISRAEFHLDRELAYKEAGLDQSASSSHE